MSRSFSILTYFTFILDFYLFEIIFSTATNCNFFFKNKIYLKTKFIIYSMMNENHKK